MHESATTRSRPSARFRVLTYNIHRAIGLDRQFRPERIIEILAHYGPDLVLLQEVDDGVPRSRGLDLARVLAGSLGYLHYVVGHNVTLRQGRYGNAILSRQPIRMASNIDLTVGARKRRGCQHARVLVDGAIRAVEVFNVHLGLSARERQQQVRILARSPEFVRLGREVPCIVAGDFNDWRSMLRPIFVEGLGFECATDRGRSGQRAMRTYPSFSPSGGLDRIYHRGTLRLVGVRRCGLRVSRVASDHLPVIADFEIPS